MSKNAQSKQCEGISRNGERCNKKVKIQKDKNENRVLCWKHVENTLVYKIKNDEKNKNIKKEESVNVTDNLPSDCPICLDNVKTSDNADFACGHAIHIDCAKQLHNNQCPVCRAEISTKKLSKKEINTIKEKYKNDKNTENTRLLRELLANDPENNRGHFGPVDGDFVDGIQSILNMVMRDAVRFSQLELNLRRAEQNIPHFSEIMKNYKSLLGVLKEKIDEYPALDFIIEIFSTINCITEIYETSIPIPLIHDIFSEDIPPLYPDMDDYDLHQLIHLALGMEINEH